MHACCSLHEHVHLHACTGNLLSELYGLHAACVALMLQHAGILGCQRDL